MRAALMAAAPATRVQGTDGDDEEGAAGDIFSHSTSLLHTEATTADGVTFQSRVIQ